MLGAEILFTLSNQSFTVGLLSFLTFDRVFCHIEFLFISPLNEQYHFFRKKNY